MTKSIALRHAGVAALVALPMFVAGCCATGTAAADESNSSSAEASEESLADTTENRPWAERWAAKWKCGRYDLAHEYLATHEVASMSVPQVISDLGKPNEVINYWSYALSDQGVLEYGPHWIRDFWTHPSLDVHFSVEQLVTEMRVSWKGELPVGRPFDAAMWREVPLDERAAFVADLLAQRTFVGWSKSDLQRELGQPEYATPWVRLRYVVDFRVIDPQILEIVADQDGVVRSAVLRDG